MSFEGLPYELLTHIVHYVGDPKTLAKLSRVSYRLHTLIEPLLYGTVSLQSASAAECRLLVRTMLERPDLAKRVRTVALDQDSSDPLQSCIMDDGLFKPCKNADDLHLHDKVQKVIREEEALTSMALWWKAPPTLVDRNPKTTWWQDLYEGKSTAYMAVLLAIVPNLKELNIGKTARRSWPLTVVEAAAGIRPNGATCTPQGSQMLTKLKRVNVVGFTGAIIQEDAPYAYLPGLTELTAIGVGCAKIDEITTSRCLTKVYLLACDVRQSHLTQLLKYAKGLKEFSLLFPMWVVEHALNFSTLAEDLLHVKSSLQKLEIIGTAMARRSTGTVGLCLQEFERLEIVRIDAVRLFLRHRTVEEAVPLAEYLPPTLRDLELWMDHSTCYFTGHQLERFPEMKGICFPRLEAIRVYLYPGGAISPWPRTNSYEPLNGAWMMEYPFKSTQEQKEHTMTQLFGQYDIHFKGTRCGYDLLGRDWMYARAEYRRDVQWLVEYRR